jgi:tetratricopeptide (TPR) repeat protein
MPCSLAFELAVLRPGIVGGPASVRDVVHAVPADTEGLAARPERHQRCRRPQRERRGDREGLTDGVLVHLSDGDHQLLDGAAERDAAPGVLNRRVEVVLPPDPPTALMCAETGREPEVAGAPPAVSRQPDDDEGGEDDGKGDEDDDEHVFLRGDCGAAQPAGPLLRGRRLEDELTGIWRVGVVKDIASGLQSDSTDISMERKWRRSPSPGERYTGEGHGNGLCRWQGTEASPTKDEAMDLDPDLFSRWRDAKGQERSRFYLEHLLPRIEEALSRRDNAPVHRFDVLVSLMGTSPEPIALMASVVRPERLVVIRGSTPDDDPTAAAYDLMSESLVAREVLPASRIEQVRVDPLDPRRIYAAVREAIQGARRPGVDVTGGKKVMSATAAQAAWELNVPLCYVDSKHDQQLRGARPGTETVIVLENPSLEKARIERQRAWEYYTRRDFNAAVETFRKSAGLNADNAEDELGEHLSCCYAALMDLDLKLLATRVDELSTFCATERMRSFVERRRLPSLDSSVQALRKVARGEKIALLASYLTLGRLYAEVGRHDFACLLAYRCHEGTVEERLVRAAPGFRTSEPDYSLLGDRQELETRYRELSRQVDGERAEPGLPRKVGLVNGFALLCLTDRLHERLWPKCSLPDAVKRLRGLAKRRNGSILAHGTSTLTKEDSDDLLGNAEALLRGALGEVVDELDLLILALKPLPVPGPADS